MTRAAPKRSLITPTSGCVKPTASWPSASARLRLARPAPVAVLSGETNSQKAERVPTTSAIKAAAASVRRQAFAFIMPPARLQGA
jgi:hypothetical protein